jgi:cell wall-associated NlpC family hydrolase
MEKEGEPYMKWVFGILAILILGWYVTVYFFNRNRGEKTSLMTTDSLQAKAPLSDSADSSRINPDSIGLDIVKAGEGRVDTIRQNQITLPEGHIDTKGVHPREVVAFAKTQIGVPYLYGSTDPAKGFDCSGFITYVFKHFDIVVPRSSIDFTHVGTEISAANAKPGDLVLFTGTNPHERFVGHMGIVVDNSDSLRFIHSTSGKAHGVTITPLNDYYKGRYVKTIRIFPQNR